MFDKLWSKKGEDILFKNDFWTYKIDHFYIDQNRASEYHYVHTPGSVMIIPLLSNSEVLLVSQFRYLLQKTSLEFPGGGIKDGGVPDKEAIRELREETGFSADKIIKAGEFAPYNGVADEICSVFIAMNLYESPLKGDEPEFPENHVFAPEQVDKMIATGELWDGMTIASWTIAKRLMK